MDPNKKPVILDTRTWLWFVLGNQKISGQVKSVITKAASAGNLYLSIISVHETANLVANKRLFLKKPCNDWIKEALELSKTKIMQITPDIAIESCNLPTPMTKLDATDKMIIATARLMGASIITPDRNIIEYGHNKHVEVTAV